MFTKNIKILSVFFKRVILKKNIIIFGTVLLMSFGFLFYFYAFDTVYTNCTIELGEEVTATLFEKRGFGSISFLDGSQTMQVCDIGEYEIEVKKGLFTHQCVLVVEDTTAPTGEAADIVVSYLDTVDINQLVDNIVDESVVSCTLITEIDYTCYDMQEISILLVDSSGNETLIISLVTVTGDETPPVIEAPSTITVYAGGTISYLSQITVSDESDYELDVDNSAVDLNCVGSYVVTVTATDVLGNSSDCEITVKVIEETYAETTTESQYEVIQRLADELLSEIINDSMTLTEKASAIYYWCRNTIKYTGVSDKTDWMKEAYDGLVYKSGDCFTYASTAKILLTQAGIPNLDIERTPTETTTYYSHYWNLVDVGYGWVHFDSTYRSDGTIIFLWDTETLLEYSDSHNYCHNFTASNYPTIN